jgi:hypothetical protein
MLADDYPYLKPIQEGDKPWVQGAKNLRLLLKEKFPGVKFSVGSKAFAGGNAIDVYWVDGPTSEQVEKFLDLFRIRNFDGRTDSFNFRYSEFTELFGGACFVFGNRKKGLEGLKVCWVKLGQKLGNFLIYQSVITNENVWNTTTAPEELVNQTIQLWQETDFAVEITPDMFPTEK